ncbi:MAG TPA: urease accessory protein [Cycloclasticus sp.]|jgi:high-affinity nickel permease|nr:urease accessory protein [Cycloclasticus sp.]HIL91990.1 urease accessory protein [Cycloclasticus sp.]
MDFNLLFLGFLIGMRHALEADHVAAVASLATGSNLRGTIMQGAAWGLGHTLTLFLFGSIALLIDGIIPNNFSAALEFSVGIMLVLLGLDVLYRLYKKRIHFHTHQHGEEVKHFHAHAHKKHENHTAIAHQHVHKKVFPKRALLIGLMHGMAGSSALIILTMQTVQTPSTALLYIALFGAGSILGMALLSCVIAIPLRYSSHKLTHVYNSLHLGIAVCTVSVGSLIINNYLQLNAF